LNDTIGTCGFCGGPVKFTSTAASYQDPRCERCGARPKNAYGPVLDMQQGTAATRVSHTHNYVNGSDYCALCGHPKGAWVLVRIDRGFP
jgi:ribosomal protein S14